MQIRFAGSILEHGILDRRILHDSVLHHTIVLERPPMPATLRHRSTADSPVIRSHPELPMDNHKLRLFANNLDYAQRLSADLSESDLRHQPAPGVNPPLWILGHLAICTDYGLELMGHAKRCPKSWHVVFGPGSQPDGAPTAVPTKAELMNHLVEGHAAMVGAFPEASPEIWTKPNPVDFLVSRLPTVGDLMAHLLTTHEAMHLGQFSAWRRVTGRPSV